MCNINISQEGTNRKKISKRVWGAEMKRKKIKHCSGLYVPVTSWFFNE